MITELKGYVKAAHTSLTKVVALILALAVLCAGTAFAASSSYTVDIYDGNEITRVETSRSDAEAIVKQAEISLGEKDRLDLSGFSAGVESTIKIYRAAAISFTDIDGNVTYTVFAGTVSDLLRELSVTLGEKQLITQPLNKELTDGMEIKVTNAYNLSVTADGISVNLTMGEGTVADALNKAGISLGKDDEVSPSLDSMVFEGSDIQVYRVEYSYRTVIEDIAFAKKTVKSADLFKNDKQVTQEGANGSQRVTYCDKIVNGSYSSSEAVTSTIIKEPVTQITAVGTKQKAVSIASLKNSGTPISELTPPSSLVIENGAPTSYSKIITGKAAAYTANAGAHTSTGRTVKPGYIAVNPKQIPYGSEMWIVSTDGIVYGYAIAADTGGFIHKGKFTVDLFMNTNSQCTQWGARDVVIYVL